MNRLSHMMFAFSLFVGMYSLVYAYSVWASDIGRLMELSWYYMMGGMIVTIVAVPILYWKAPHKDMSARTTSNKSSIGALMFVTFCIGSLAGSIVYQWISGVPIFGNLSIFIGSFIIISGALAPDWDIPLLGISRHRNLIFHSVILPFFVTITTFVNVITTIVEFNSITNVQHFASVELYITAIFLIGYASHLYLDIFPSDASPLEILWRAANPTDKAPTGLKPLGPIKISKNQARGWLVLNATILVIIALALLGLYFINLPDFSIP